MDQTAAATVFNHFVAAHVVHALTVTGLFDRLAQPAGLSIDGSSDLARYRPLLGTARELSLIETGVDGCLCLTESGKDLYRNRGFFAWAIGGYGKLLRLLDQAFGSPETLDRSSSIDGQFVALGSDLCSRALMLETFLATIEKLAPRSIADLGCGNAGRLAAVCRRLPQAHGLGIDISASAVAAARGTIDAMGLNNAISILHGNVLDVVEAAPHRDVLSKVDVVCSFMMLHDLFNAQPGPTVVRRLRTAFPNARAFVIACPCHNRS